MSKSKKAHRDKWLIKPTTEARLNFVSKFIPKWMELFGENDWEVAQRLSEEIESNFQFVDESKPAKIHDGQLRQGVSLAHIIVMQQLEIARLKQSIRTHK